MHKPLENQIVSVPGNFVDFVNVADAEAAAEVVKLQMLALVQALESAPTGQIH